MNISCTDLLEELRAKTAKIGKYPRAGDSWDTVGLKRRLEDIPGNLFGPLVEALEADLAATRHPHSCKTCQAEEWCRDRSDAVIRASGLRNDVLVKVHRDLEVALEKE